MLEARGLGLARPGRGEALADLDLALEPGRMLAIVGPNGAGKTTLVRCLAGVLKPTSGQVLLDGRPLGEFSRRDLARSVAYCPQESGARFGFSVSEAVLMGRHPWTARFGPPSDDDVEAARWAMRAMDVEGLADRPVTELSGGEHRRVALARTLAQHRGAAGRPGGRVLLLDEPVAGLDIRHALASLRLLARLARGGAVVAVVLHDLPLAAMFCPLMLMLDGGRKAAYGPTSAVLTGENIRDVFGVRAMVDGPNIRFVED